MRPICYSSLLHSQGTYGSTYGTKNTNGITRITSANNATDSNSNIINSIYTKLDDIIILN